MKINLSGILGAGKSATIDSEDYEKISKYRWHLHHTGYAATFVRDSGKKRMILMHRLILDAPEGTPVDHTNSDGLDNRKNNTRLCSYAQNGYNARLRPDNTSGHKGVNWMKSKKKWRAESSLNGKRIHIGLFEKIEDAVKAQTRFVEENHGEFARHA